MSQSDLKKKSPVFPGPGPSAQESSEVEPIPAGPALRVKYLRQIVTGVQIVADGLCVPVAYGLAFVTWNRLGPWLFPHEFIEIPFAHYNFALGITLIVSLIGFEVTDLYHPQRSILNIKEFQSLLKSWAGACVVTLLVLFLAQKQYFPRPMFLLTWGNLLLLWMAERYAFFRLHDYLRKKGFVETTALIYGAGVVGRRLLKKLRESPKLGYQVVGFIDDGSRLRDQKVDDIPVLGDYGKLATAIQKTGAEKLFIALPRVPRVVIVRIMEVCKKTGCDFQIVPKMYDIVIQRVKLSEVDGIPLIGVTEPRLSRTSLILKRSFDLALALPAFLILLPVMLVIAIVIRFDSHGSPLFVQNRIGLNGKPFPMLKFRSMRIDAPKYMVTPDSSSDPRITRVGKYLRKTSLDELPQIWNVIRGEMSIVGPRPEMPFIVEKYDDLERQRLNVQPGITGLWQISADRKAAIHENMDYDIYYIENQSVLLDIVILLRTLRSLFGAIGAH